jgi:hypothetical protein
MHAQALAFGSELDYYSYDRGYSASLFSSCSFLFRFLAACLFMFFIRSLSCCAVRPAKTNQFAFNINLVGGGACVCVRALQLVPCVFSTFSPHLALHQPAPVPAAAAVSGVVAAELVAAELIAAAGFVASRLPPAAVTASSPAEQ